MIIFPIALLLIALFLESSVVSLPLVLLVLISFTVIYRNYPVFILAFIFGIILDVLTFKTVGMSSLFFTIVIFLILIYEKKFEIKTNYFIILASFLASFFFLLIFKNSNLILQSFFSILIGLLIFQVLNKSHSNKTISNS